MHFGFGHSTMITTVLESTTYHIVTMPFHVILGANHFTIAVYNRMKVTVYPCVKWKLVEDMY